MVKSIPNDIFQYSLRSAYDAGLKDGGPPVGFLANHGDHGIGLFENDDDNDGDGNDLIQLDGVAYTIDKDGDVEVADSEDELPFVMVTVFQPFYYDTPSPNTTSKKLQEQVLFGMVGKNTPLPFRLRGTFRYINTQQRTYWDVEGTIFGFVIPGWQKAVSGEGLQCCFLGIERDCGGRVVDFETGMDTLLEWAKCGTFHLGFPRYNEFGKLRL